MKGKTPGLSGPVRAGPLYWVERAILRVIIFFVLFGGRLHQLGRDNVPRKGGLLVISNHIATGDPPLEGAMFPRPVHFMAKAEWFTGNRLIGYLARQFLCFPVNRHTADRAALRYTLALLERGQAVLVYPEGTRSVDHQMHRAEAGIGFLARKSGVPILPLAIWGTEKVMPKGSHMPRPEHAHITYGEPFHLPESMVDNRVAADFMMARVAELLPREYRGESGGWREAALQEATVG